MTFLRMTNLRGGPKLKHLWTWPCRENENLSLEKELEPKIVEGKYCMRLGTVSRDLKAGDKVWVEPQNALYLYRLLKAQFE